MKTNSWLVRVTKLGIAPWLIAAPLVLTGCVNDDGGDETARNADLNSVANDPVLLTAYFTAFADNVAIPSYQAFKDLADTAAASTGAISVYCDSIGTASEAAELVNAQAQWRDLMDSWQQVEAFPVGPIAANNGNLGNRIYSWPDTVSSCNIDIDIIASTEEGFDITSRTARGLDVLEYPLFNSELDHTCASQISATSSWNALSDQSRKQQRCDYAERVVADVATTAGEILNAWLDNSGAYRSDLIGAGSDGSSFASQDDALMAILDALLYIDTDVKDLKLAVPTGLSSDCSDTSCPDNVESSLSEHSIANLIANVTAFRAVFSGSFTTSSNATGLDDLINDKDFSDLSSRVLTNTDQLLSLLNSFSGTLAADVTTINSSARHTECQNSSITPSSSSITSCGLHGQVKLITDDLRGDVLTVLSLSLPTRVEGDND